MMRKHGVEDDSGESEAVTFEAREVELDVLADDPTGSKETVQTAPNIRKL
jgi:hypothetical protein